MSLPFALQLGTLETPSDFASRLSVRVFRNNLREFCLDFGMDATRLVNGHPNDIRILAELSGVGAEGMQAGAFERIGDTRRYRHRGEVLVRSCLCRDRVRACLVCLSEDIAAVGVPENARPYRRSTWIVDAVRTCPTHGIGLVDLGTGSAALQTHDIQHVLADAIGSIDELTVRANRRVATPFERYALGRLGAGAVGGAGLGTSWLDGLELHAALRLCLVVGAVSRSGPRVALDGLDGTERHLAEADGFEILRGGEIGLREFLDSLQASFRGGRADWGPKEMFGRLYEWLAHETDDPAYDAVRDIIRRHVTETMPIGPGETLFGRDVTTRRVHSLHSASLEFGLHPKRTRKLLRDAGIIGQETDGLSNERVTFDAEVGGRFLSDVASSMSLVRLGQYLGTPRPHERLLFEAGYLKPWIVGGTDDLKDHAFRKSNADAFLTALLADADPKLEEAPGLYDIPSAAKRACVKAEQIVGFLLNRKLRRVGRSGDAHGYLSVLVDPEEVKRLVAGPDHGGITMKQLEKELRTSTRVVVALIEHGVLAVEMVPNPVNKRIQTIVRPEALERFRSEYVSLQGLAEERGEHFRRTKEYLVRLGISPAFPPEAMGASWYRRSSFSLDDPFDRRLIT